MLSRFILNGNILRRALKFQTSFITTSARVATDKKNDPSQYPPEYPPATSKRDFINFPRITIRETPPPVRLLFVPESWFTFMYPKTGHTGPYMLVFGGMVYLVSKELITCVEEFIILISVTLFIVYLRNKFGDKVGKFYASSIQADIDALDKYQESEKSSTREVIKELKKFDQVKEALYEVGKAKVEIVQIQLENAFRDRIVEAYKLVKNKLDCQAELENVEKQAVIKNLMEYVLRNVMSSITPELEKNVMQKCIADLNNLTVKV